MKVMIDVTKKISQKERWTLKIDGGLLSYCEKVWLHPEKKKGCKKWYWWLEEMKKKDDKKQIEESISCR